MIMEVFQRTDVIVKVVNSYIPFLQPAELKNHKSALASCRQRIVNLQAAQNS